MRAIRMGICAAVAFGVLAHGAVEVWSESVLLFAAAALLALWATGVLRGRQESVHLSPLIWPMLALWAWVGVQWLAGISVAPDLTRAEFLKASLLVIFFFLAGQSLREPGDVRKFVWFLLAFGFCVALFGIVQHFSYEGKLYWLRPLAQGAPFGPYVNRNHFAGFVELVAPLGLAIVILRALPRDQLLVAGLLALVPLGAVFLSASRSGILMVLCQAGMLAAATVRGKSRRPLFILLLLASVGAGFVVWLGMQSTWQRFERVTAYELGRDLRNVIYRDTWRIFRDHPVAGTGAGTLVTVYPQYESLHTGKVVDHAHNDYLQLLAETGLIGGLCGIAFLALLLAGMRHQLERPEEEFPQAVRLGASVACAGLLLHGLVDFNFQIPANALLFFLQAHLATFESPSAAGKNS